MRYQFIVTLALVFGCIMAVELQDQFEIDNALQALIDLRDDSKDSLYELEETWRIINETLRQQESSLFALIANKQEQCKADEDAQHKTEEDLKKTNEYIEWLEKLIQDTKDKLQDLLTRRCELNKQFIDGIKREKIAMSLLEFIRLAIEKKDTFDFVQMQKFNKNFASFLQAYEKSDFNALMLIQDDLVDSDSYNVDVDFSTSDRTDEEIGIGHLDNNKGNIDLDDFSNGRRRNWQAYKTELLQLLAELKQKIADKIKKAIDDEIAASVSLANYKNHALREIEQLEKELEEQRAIKVQLEAQLQNDTQGGVKCRSDLFDLEAQLRQVQDEIEQRDTIFYHKQALLQDEIDIFNEVIAEYENSIYATEEEFKARQDDYIDDGDFDNGQYNEREVPKIDLLNDQGQGLFL